MPHMGRENKKVITTLAGLVLEVDFMHQLAILTNTNLRSDTS
jgi:hypothetical protein